MIHRSHRRGAIGLSAAVLTAAASLAVSAAPAASAAKQTAASAAKQTAASAAKQTAPAAGRTPVKLDHAFVIMIENHGRNSVIGDRAAPYITSLARTYGVATRYYGVTHPSLPNYVAAISGSNWETNSDDPLLRFNHANIVDQLETAGRTWGAYMESMPRAGYLGSFWPSETKALYANKHNPFILMTDIRSSATRRADIKPYSALRGDLNSGHAPAYVWITPNQCHDMHGGVGAVRGQPETPCPYAVSKGDKYDQSLKRKADAFVQQAVRTIISSRAWTARSAIFLVADEGDYTGIDKFGGWESPAGCCDSPYIPAGDPRVAASWPGGVYGGALIPAIVITGAGRRHVVDNTPYNHYSMLRTIETGLGLRHLVFASDSRQVKTMYDLINP